MQMTLRSVLIFLICSFYSAIGYSAGNAVPLTNAHRPATSGLFEYHSGFWMNLHMFLQQQAFFRKPGYTRFGSRKDSVAINFPDSVEQRHWMRAIHYYEDNLMKADLLDSSMERIKNIIEDHDGEQNIQSPELPAGMASVLNDVASSYRIHFWAAQNEKNLKWISATQMLVEKYGDRLRMELTEIYLTPWPKEPIRVDLTCYASWSGAYTTLNPNRVTISSTDSNNQGLLGLEILFHEASHTLINKIRLDIIDILNQDKKYMPHNDLWHALLFYTTGEIMRENIKEYVPYAEQLKLWQRAWPSYLPWFQKHWYPYLQHSESYQNALHRLVIDAETAQK